MDTSVRLQDMFSHSKIPMLIVLGMITAILLFIVISLLIKRLKKLRNNKRKPVVMEKKPVNVMEVKQNYLNRLMMIEVSYQRGECTVRSAYQNMSAIIRGFVEELTGIKVQNCTLQDIKFLHMPVLEELMEEYYSPEFAKKSEGDVMASIKRTRGAIERWN